MPVLVCDLALSFLPDTFEIFCNLFMPKNKQLVCKRPDQDPEAEPCTLGGNIQDLEGLLKLLF